MLLQAPDKAGFVEYDKSQEYHVVLARSFQDWVDYELWGGGEQKQ